MVEVNGEKVFVSASLKGENELQYFSRETLSEIRSETSTALKQADESLEAAAEREATVVSVSSGCFLADTKILMQDGSYKNIQDILVGDKVTAFDIYNKKPANAEATTTFTRNETRYRIIGYEVIQ